MAERMAERIVIIGGDAAGMTAASQAKRLRPDLEVIAFERGRFASYSACGIPYWVAGDVGDPDNPADPGPLIARAPKQHRENGIDLRMRTEVVEVDLDRGTVDARSHETGQTERLGFDQVVFATGAVPVRPKLPGADADGIYGVQTLDDGAAVIAALTKGPRRAVVVGGGYVGVEMAEALCRHGLEVTIVERDKEPMKTLDPDMGALVHDAMERMGIDVRTSLAVEGFEVGADGQVRGVAAGAQTLPADVVVLGLGVRPGTALARAAGLPVGAAGGLCTDLRMRIPGRDGVWAAGDCVETIDRVSGQRVHVPLGTHANKQGRVVGTNIGGGYATFPGIVRTAVSRVCDLEIARTGLLEADAEQAGFGFVTARVESTTRAGYFPGAAPITVKILAERRTGRMLGGQIVGQEDSGKRIDTLAVALWNEMTVEEVTALDLGYAPPFSPVWDPVLIAARKAADAVRSARE
jgi:NADPH-dependent 2,4-dienoyl-CoA reductase/sulfur reductase-like enzyme